MFKPEINEIKKRFTQSKCAIDKICGCYVDAEKNKKMVFKEPFLALPDEDMFKYFEIFRKALSGTIGKNLVNLEFPLASEEEGGTQNTLLKLRDSKLNDDSLLESYYDKIIESYDYVGNYLILIIHDNYDIPCKTTDGIEVEDGSDEVYEYTMTVICPVNLSKPGLSYFQDSNSFANRIRDWVVEMPEFAFVFPAFNDRSTDIHSTLFYTKDAADFHDTLTDSLFGSTLPLTAAVQKETFQTIIEETLGDDCEMEVVKTIHENLCELVEEHSEDVEPLSLGKQEIKRLFADSGVKDEKLEDFDNLYEAAAGGNSYLQVSNVYNKKSFEVKTPDISIKVSPERLDLISKQDVNGRPCIVIEISDQVEVNGIPVSTGYMVTPDEGTEE